MKSQKIDALHHIINRLVELAHEHPTGCTKDDLLGVVEVAATVLDCSLRQKALARIPMFTTAAVWALDLFRLGLRYHPRQDPSGSGMLDRRTHSPSFYTDTECKALIELGETMSTAEVREFYDALHSVGGK